MLSARPTGPCQCYLNAHELDLDDIAMLQMGEEDWGEVRGPVGTIGPTTPWRGGGAPFSIEGSTTLSLSILFDFDHLAKKVRLRNKQENMMLFSRPPLHHISLFILGFFFVYCLKKHQSNSKFSIQPGSGVLSAWRGALASTLRIRVEVPPPTGPWAGSGRRAPLRPPQLPPSPPRGSTPLALREMFPNMIPE